MYIPRIRVAGVERLSRNGWEDECGVVIGYLCTVSCKQVLYV